MSSTYSSINLSPISLPSILNDLHISSVTHSPSPPSTALSQLIDSIGSARVVLIGECTHGTEEFYRIRAALSKYLMEYRAFDFIAVEADWPDMVDVNRFVQKGNHHQHNVTTSMKSINYSAFEALEGFTRWPQWMWRNYAFYDFIEWLRDYNHRLISHSSATLDVHSDTPPTPLPIQKGVYGLDLYSLGKSSHRVIEYLDSIDKSAADRARDRYSLFYQNYYINDQDQETEGEDDQNYNKNISPEKYGLYVLLGLLESQEQGVIDALIELIKNEPIYIKGKGGHVDGEEYLYARENARVVKDAENYYRNMYIPTANTWNIRDSHMTDTVGVLLEHFQSLHQKFNSNRLSRGIVWAHNSHIGDASATDRKRMKEHNIGQLCRKIYGESNCFSIGFTTYNGTVSASDNWGGLRQSFRINDALEDSYENLFHGISKALKAKLMRGDIKKNDREMIDKERNNQFDSLSPNQCSIMDYGSLGDFCLLLRSNSLSIIPHPSTISFLHSNKNRIERAIGVCYKKETERQSHYFHCNLIKQFDYLIHCDTSHYLQPLPIADKMELIEGSKENQIAKQKAMGEELNA